MNSKRLPDIEKIKALLRYEPSTGKLYWRERTPESFVQREMRPASRICDNWNSRFSGAETFTGINAHGYKVGHILGIPCYAHRIIWAMANDAWPDGEIDHINGNPLDNRICNLRVATRRQNECNKGLQRNNTSGVKGVCWNKKRGKWKAQITVNGKLRHLGEFACINAAADAYAQAANESFGEFARPTHKQEGQSHE